MIRFLGALLLARALCAQPASADVAAGAKTFRSHCAVCHGTAGEGGRGPSLSAGVYHHGGTDADLLRNISNGIPGTDMPGIFYNEDRVRQVVAYLRSLNTSQRTAGDPARGREIYAAQGCAQCHRVSGAGGRLGPDLSEIGRARAAAHLRQALLSPDADVREDFWVVSFTNKDGSQQSGFLRDEDTYTVLFLDFEENLRSAAKADVRDYQVTKTSRMPSYREALKENELDDLVAWLSSLKGGAR
jgi:putative heme-binding domain-containing protein